MQYMTGVYWNRGGRASCNQDSVVLHQVLTRRGRVLMAAVCDGMGGMRQGEIASGYMAERLQEWFYDSLMRAVEQKKPCWMIRRSMDRLVYHAQEQLRQYAGKEEAVRQMSQGMVWEQEVQRRDEGASQPFALGTTMSVLVLWDRTYLIWHLGDSRIYRIRSNGGGQLYSGRDRRYKQDVRGRQHRQSAWNRRRDGHGASDRRQKIPECMTRDHVRGRNRLTKCVGSFGYFRPDYRMGTVQAGEAFLLCSDGFRHCITGQELADILAPQQLREEAQVERRLREIGETCMRRGEKDNLSAVCIRTVK